MIENIDLNRDLNHCKKKKLLNFFHIFFHIWDLFLNPDINIAPCSQFKQGQISLKHDSLTIRLWLSCLITVIMQACNHVNM